MNVKRGIRRSSILEIVARSGEVSVENLARQFGVSVMTIRRDLAHLSRAGRLSRIHGGAVPSRAGVIEFSFHEKGNRRAVQKRAIASKVAAMVSPGMAISLDTGTTTLEIARALSGTSGVTVLTTSLAIASVLYANDNIELVLLGGNVRKNSPDLMGPLTEDNLKRFRIHLAVLGADAVTPDGIFTTDIGISRISRAMVENADNVVLAVDSTKFTQTAFVKCVSLQEIDRLVTDDGCSEDIRAWLEEAIDEVVYVSTNANEEQRTFSSNKSAERHCRG